MRLTFSSMAIPSPLGRERFVKAVVETLELCNQHPGMDVSGKDVATMFGEVDGRLRESEAKFAMDDDE